MLSGPFLGVEALRAAQVRKHELRSRFSAVFPGVYLTSHLEPTFAHRVEAAWLWSRRGGVIAGLSAARLYGSKWIDDTEPVELVWANARAPLGIVTSALTLAEGETVMMGRLPVTSLVRTAFDLARRRPSSTAVARLDALGAAAPFDCAAVLRLLQRHRGARGVRQVATALDLYDGGAQSPRETWLRLLLIGAGYPVPRTQIPVRVDGRIKYYLDMGWEHLKIAVEYDGDHHRTDRVQFARDIARLEELAVLGWNVVRVAVGTPRDEILARLRRAWLRSSTLR